MLASTPNREYVSFRATKRDHSVSPSCRTSFGLQTPPRFPTTSLSPMFTPPLRRHDPPSAEPMDMDDVFSSPPCPTSYTYKSPKTRSTHLRLHADIDNDEEDGNSSLLAPSSSFSLSRSLVPPTSPFPPRTPLRTPVRQSSRLLGTPDRPALSVKPLNFLAPSSSSHAAGVKRKPAPNTCVTPSRDRTLTPLTVTSAATRRQDDSSAVSFDRLAPLPAPRFNIRTPQTGVEAELHLKKQAETMTMLKISDMHCSDESGYDTGPDSRGVDDQGQMSLFETVDPPAVPSTVMKAKRSARAVPKTPALEVFIRKGQVNNEEVAEAISPGGHITKRRARSRPVSAELLESAQSTPAEFENKAKAIPRIHESKSASSVAFPSVRARRTSGSSTSSETGSPIPRQRLPPGPVQRIRTQSHASQGRMPLSRVTSSGSATMFFGPSIPNNKKSTNKASPRSTLNTSSGPSRGTVNAATRQTPERGLDQRSRISNRHSYAAQNTSSPLWEWADRALSSPLSSPNSRKRLEDSSDDEDFFFGGPPDTSFAFSLTQGTPSPKKKQKRDTPSPLPKKFRPRDSGIALDSSDDDSGLNLFKRGDLFMPPMPRASTSVSTVNSEEDRALVTPVFAPSPASGWPSVNVHLSSDDFEDSAAAFIIRTLQAGAAKTTQVDEQKRVPGTPVKKVKTAYLAERPWQSAVASRIGFPGFDDDLPPEGGKKAKGKPRKSLPAAFPLLGKENRAAGKGLGKGGLGKLAMDADIDGEDEDTSPIARKNQKYEGLGLGRPVGAPPAFARPSGDEKSAKTHWLMRRSSSGAFSSGGETAGSNAVTPTRNSVREWGLPPPRIPVPISPLKNVVDVSGDRLSPGSTSSASTALNSPTIDASIRHFRHGASAHPQPTPVRPPIFVRPQTHAHPARLPLGHTSPPRVGMRGRLSLPTGEERPGRFGRDFVEVDELGTGEFGRVMKVRYKEGVPVIRGKEGEYYAVKKSKRFEGAKHRLRLREEVDILAHLSARGGHANVLAHIDSWEEEETLYIRTELCSLGNFAHFLTAYGRAYPKLDEGRVWRVLAELSGGLHFIHDAGVIHLDLKPANIFITNSGRLRIGDFGMASLWPRPAPLSESLGGSAFEREGDKLYLAPEVLQGRYGKAADVFSLGMTMLETATNVVVPDQGESWHRLRREDFSQVDSGLASLSADLRQLLRSMMRTEPAQRAHIGLVATNPVVLRARAAMEGVRAAEGDVFAASPLGAGGKEFLEDILHRGGWDSDEMDLRL
ncbi:uncharacterized protein FIBRA_02302 [Fibroporia radiculosa]|uniref:Protein kinase domain-containing protein n=1 Tax=Fibroporia radiculosa TaxID=599839 RepID=J4HUP5_9APHY|nr:uncharacterized protein FIBRA_02302 [Fibroporia radiculosa]CCM00272.1 predicted protein [Fibroporia radiculosa]